MRKDGIAKALGVEKEDVEVIVVPADGDCFYASISAAGKGDPSISIASSVGVQELRDLVAAELLGENLEMFQVADLAGVEGYEHVRGLDLEGLKATVRRVAADKRGCVWADDFAVNTVAKCLDVALLILNEGARRGGSVLAIVPNSPRDDYRELSCILLQRTRRVHYNLIQLRGRSATPVSLLPPQIARTVQAVAIGDNGGESSGGGSSVKESRKRSAPDCTDEKGDPQGRGRMRKSTR